MSTDYKLATMDDARQRGSFFGGLTRLVPLLLKERGPLTLALAAISLNALSTLLAPIIIAHIIDAFIDTRDMPGLFEWSGILLATYLVGVGANYVQTITMGSIGRRVLFDLRNAIFTKLSELPVAFFNQNKAGDIISRINNDTDKLNQFFAQALMQFIGNSFIIAGAAVFLLVLDVRLGAAALVPALVVLALTQLLSPWVKRASFTSLQSLGAMSGEIQESINNFKVIVAFNRLDYFRDKFRAVNAANFKANIAAGIASGVFTPLYGLAYNLGQLIVLSYGIYLISAGQFTVGLLVGFLLYVNSFYNPLRQLASVWSSLQLALAGLDRISEVLALTSDMAVLPGDEQRASDAPILEFNDVSFHYSDGPDVLKHLSLKLERGKTYALVGPTGGGKTTTANLMARLYDATEGTVLLKGRDIRAYAPDEKAAVIGFILQEPFLFSGTLRDNIVYGNARYHDTDTEQLLAVLKNAGLDGLLGRFEQGLDTPMTSSADVISLGQKQLIAFIRAVLRSPEILILDEATANIDTVTEAQLEAVLSKLPQSTTKVIIAHRLNTIENADEIFFVNAGTLTRAGSMEQALDLLMHGKRTS